MFVISLSLPLRHLLCHQVVAQQIQEQPQNPKTPFYHSGNFDFRNYYILVTNARLRYQLDV